MDSKLGMAPLKELSPKKICIGTFWTFHFIIISKRLNIEFMTKAAISVTSKRFSLAGFF